MKTAFNGGRDRQLRGGGETTVQWTMMAAVVAMTVTAAMRTTTAATAMATTATAVAMVTEAGTDNNHFWHWR